MAVVTVLQVEWWVAAVKALPNSLTSRMEQRPEALPGWTINPLRGEHTEARVEALHELLFNSSGPATEK